MSLLIIAADGRISLHRPIETGDKLKAVTGGGQADAVEQEFYCHPCCGEEVDPDGKPSMVTECKLEFADRISIYRRNDLEVNPDAMPSEWVFDILIEGRVDRERDLSIAEGLCELLNTLSPADAVSNPKLHVLFT